MPVQQAFCHVLTTAPALWPAARDALWNLARSCALEAELILSSYIEEGIAREGRVCLGSVDETELLACGRRTLPPPARAQRPIDHWPIAARALALQASVGPHGEQPLQVLATDTEILYVSREIEGRFGSRLVGQHLGALLEETIDIPSLALRSAAGFHFSDAEPLTITLQMRGGAGGPVVGTAIGIPVAMSLAARPLAEFMASVRAALGISNPDGRCMYFRTIDSPRGVGERFVLVPLAWRLDLGAR